MIRINLLPIRQIKKRAQSRNEVITIILGLVVVLLVLGAISYAQGQKITSLQERIAVLQKERTKYDKVIKQIKKIEKEKHLLETKLGVIKDLKTSSQIPVRVLDEIANLTPANRMWLKSLELTGVNLNLSGTALDNETIAQYMLSLEQSPFFTKAELMNSSLTVVEGQKLKSFVLTVSLVQLAGQSEPQDLKKK